MKISGILLTNESRLFIDEMRMAMDREKGVETSSIDQTDVEGIRALGRLIRQKRIEERLTLERAAEQSNVSAATLSRLERQAETKAKKSKGFITPDTRTITALVQWLGVSLNDIIKGATSKALTLTPKVVEGEVVIEGEIINASTPQIVEAYLRADRNLSPQAAAMLAEMFQLAYRQYSQMSDAKLGLPPTDEKDNQSSD
jgi:transcriptional regulator with XRE-family HTH domain